MFLDSARRYLGAIKERLTPVSPGQKILPGMEVVSAPGHTPGFITLLITSGKEALLNSADTVHTHVQTGSPTPSGPSPSTRIRRWRRRRGASSSTGRRPTGCGSWATTSRSPGSATFNGEGRRLQADP